MPRRTVFLDSDSALDAPTGRLLLGPGESHHLIRVLRARTGDPVYALDGCGALHTATLEQADPARARLLVTHTVLHPPPTVELILCQALPKSAAFEEILHTAVELGVTRIIPVLSAHTENRPSSRPPKWDLLLRAAAKQSHNPWLPRLHDPTPLSALLSPLPAAPAPGPAQAAFSPASALCLLASTEPGSPPLPAVLAGLGAEPLVARPPAAVLIGPEGDFSPAEYASLRAAGWTPVSLGPIILRAPTAALALLSTLRLLALPRA